MIEKTLANADFIKLMQKNCYEILHFLTKENTEFSIVVNPKFVDFDPALPSHLDLSKEPFTRFVLGGYTFDSIVLNEKSICFHAGFGPDDFATFVNVDLGAITQIIVNDAVIFINFSFYTRKKDTQALAQNSKNIFLNNPKNKEKFKK
ncbi:hypothetical protein [Campylobacter sp. US33a]|uniref:Uncharacterized protein n=1 Tax=Campylobacter sp. CCS1377 TaxID=3158229 RepID=A0AAU7E845_9BACT|nr:hypothetical protein [Campylobacter sp. US33a]TEY04570.1 hypothetical protein ELQ16_00650 [Campylobacter sp. US33a]